MWKMIAVHCGGHVFVVFPNTFSDLVGALLPELDPLETISFKLAANTSVTSSAHIKQIPKWESLFIARLMEQMPKMTYKLAVALKGDEIPKYLPDVLEGYRANHIGAFDFAVDELYHTRDRVITLNRYDSPHLLQRITKAERDARQRVLIPMARVESVVGTSLYLELKTSTGTLCLMQDGSFVSQDGH